MPARSAVSITTFGLSTWQVTTSTPCVDHRVGGLGLLDGHGPVAGEDHLGGDARFDRACAQREGVDVAQHLRDRLGGDEAELLALAHVAGDHAVEVLRLVDVAEEAAGVLGVLALGPQAAAVGEAHVLGVLGRHGQHVRVEVAERGREQQRGAVLRDHALMVFCTATVSGTFSSSTTLTPAIFFRTAAASACAWL
jgi:hypothetical protein